MTALTAKRSRAFQKHVKRLSERGIVLAVCSKNNDADAREPFEKNPNMHLSLDDFAQFEATWDPKATAIKRIAKTLQLGLDSFVFVDDNPAEREQVRQALPEVGIVDLPEDPAEYIRALDRGLWFEAVDITERGSRSRRAVPVGAPAARARKSRYDSLDDYLTSLEMLGDVRPDRRCRHGPRGPADWQDESVQPDHAAPRPGTSCGRWWTMPDTIALTLRLADRFGDHGLVAVIMAVPDTTRPTSDASHRHVAHELPGHQSHRGGVPLQRGCRRVRRRWA